MQWQTKISCDEKLDSRGQFFLSEVQHSGVLVAGEVPLLRVLLKMALEDSGFDVNGEANDPQELLILCQSQKPSVVLIDFNIDQVELVRLIESILDIDPVIAIVVISDPIDGLGESVLASGARAYLQKPFSMYDLTDTVRKVKPIYR